MRAWVLETTDGPKSYRLQERDDREPVEGEVRVRIAASALNHLDLWVSRGRPAPPLPHVAGADGAGVIDAVGGGVTGWAVGDEVIVDPTLTCGSCADCLSGDALDCREVRIIGEHRWGTFAEQLVLPARNVTAKPPALTWTEAAAVGVITSTAYRMLRRGGVQPGSTVLVAGAGGGIGAAALAVAVAMGAEVFATSTNMASRERALELGATRAFDSREDFAVSVLEATGGRGVDCVVEHVGPATWENSIRSVRRGGRLVTCGSTSGQQVDLRLPFLFWRQIEILGSTMANPREFAAAIELVAAGDVPPIVDSVFPFDELPAALAALDGGGRFGKIVLDHGSIA